MSSHEAGRLPGIPVTAISFICCDCQVTTHLMTPVPLSTPLSQTLGSPRDEFWLVWIVGALGPRSHKGG